MNTEVIRRDIVGCHDKLFMNSAGCSLPPKIVLEKMLEYMRAEEELGGYEVEHLRQDEFSQLKTELATMINCQPVNIAYAYSASHAYAKALSSIPFQRGDYILTTDDDYVSNYISFISLQKRFGIKIARAKNLENGDLDLDSFEQQIQQLKPLLVAITHIPTNSGLVQDAAAIGRLCREHRVLYLLDACQSVGQIPVDVKHLGCDFLNATGRKFLRGPRSTGFLFISDTILEKGLEPLFIDRRGAEWTDFESFRAKSTGQRFEEQEVSASFIGLKEAVRYANKIGLNNIAEYNQTLVSRLRNHLLQIKNLRMLDKGSQLCSILTFHITGKRLEEVEKRLREKKVVYSASLLHYALIDFTKKEVDWAIRLSPHYFNTPEEMDEVADIISAI